MTAEKKRKLQDFEKSLEKLEQLATRMESGKLSLEESLRAFEEGVALAGECRTALEEAELRIEKLSAADESASAAAPDDDDSPNA